MLDKPLHLTSPHMKGQQVKDAQYLLAGNNRFEQNFHPGPVDGDFGLQAAAATKRAKWALGYPNSQVAGFWGKVFGNQLYTYLLPKSNPQWKPLPLTYRARRTLRAKQATQSSSIKAKALQIALHEASLHVHESPWGSNLQKYGQWYGFNGVPWCAIFVTYCFDHAGDKRIPKTALAFQFEWWANSNTAGLSRTSSPEPGDIVVYHHMQGHTGIFYRWIDQKAGHFQAVEGNTSNGGSQDNGGAVLIQDRYTSWVPTAFCRVHE